MKKSLLLFASLLGLIGNAQTGPSFTITNLTGSNSITCSHSSINYTANGAPNLTYVWVSSSVSLSGANVNINLPGIYTVTASDSLNTSNQIVAVGVNTVVPLSTISPSVQSISCASSSAQFVIVVSPTPTTPLSPPINLTHSITSQYGANFISNQSSSFFYQTNAPGTYTYLIIDNNNGCVATKHFTVNSASGFPTFSITSPQSFTLGCNSKSVAVINIINAQTTPTAGGAVSFTLVGPPTSTNYFPGNQSSYTVSIAGTWTAIVKDNANSCETKVPFTVLQNTASPGLNVNVPQQILDCNTSQVNLIGSSNTPNVSYQWNFMGLPGMAASNTINVQTNISAPTATMINIYTLTITDNSSTCKSVSVVPMYQNTFKPNAAISSGGIFTLTCLTPTIVLTNISTTGIPPSTGFPSTMPVTGFLWTGPSPLIPATNSSTYLASIGGTYSLSAKDLNNGCSSATSITIFDDCNKVGLEKNNTTHPSFSIFPNPNNGLFTIISNNLTENRKVEIFNSIGVMVSSELLNSERTMINIQDRVNGIYIIKVLDNTKIISVSKFIKQ